VKTPQNKKLWGDLIMAVAIVYFFHYKIKPAFWRFVDKATEEEQTTMRYGHYLLLAMFLHELMMS